MNSTIVKSHELLRLVIQKMEIYTEDGEWDEGIRSADSVDSVVHPHRNFGVNVLRQTHVVSTWKKSMKK